MWLFFAVSKCAKLNVKKLLRRSKRFVRIDSRISIVGVAVRTENKVCHLEAGGHTLNLNLRWYLLSETHERADSSLSRIAVSTHQSVW